MGREESGHYALPATPKDRTRTLLGPIVREKSTHHIGYHRESTCLFPVIENIECVHKTAQVRSSMDTLPLCAKVSIKLLRSAVLWTCLESVHRTADLSSFMDTVGKVSIKLLRSAVLWTQKLDIFKGGRKVSIKLLRSAVLWTIALGWPKSVHKTAEVQQFLSLSIKLLGSAVLSTPIICP